ncbi:hypothetical protein [Flavobacterium rhizosphaerae]|uniref:Lipoprotein n=1 Tax=Flavobacterium rhizosphaerae TaxID=3163298 RepID=A0ABW8YWZ3_9FLAO
MKKSMYKVYVLLAMAAVFTSCNTHEKPKAEAKAEAQVGKVYNPDVQGMDQETHANQFYVSRGSDKKAVTPQIATPAVDTVAQVKEANNQTVNK